VNTVAFRGAKRPKLAKITPSQNQHDKQRPGERALDVLGEQPAHVHCLGTDLERVKSTLTKEDRKRMRKDDAGVGGLGLRTRARSCRKVATPV